MRPIPEKHRKMISKDPYYRKCARLKDGGCSGRITIEHALTYAGRQIAEMWNYIPLCEKHHGVEHYSGSDSLLNKGINRSIALNRASDADLLKYDKADLIKDRFNLNKMLKFRYIQH